MGYTARPIICRTKEHLSDGPMIKHIKETKHEYKKIRFQILAQAPTNETNSYRTLVKKTRIPMNMPTIGTLSKLSNKGLNKLIYDATFRSNPDS